jgi:hypothetical protein
MNAQNRRLVFPHEQKAALQMQVRIVTLDPEPRLCPLQAQS